MKKELRIKIHDSRVICFEGCKARLSPLSEGWDLHLANINDGWSYELDGHSKAKYILHMRGTWSMSVLYFEIREWEVRKLGVYSTTHLEPIAVIISNSEHYEVTLFKDSYPFINGANIDNTSFKVKVFDLTSLDVQFLSEYIVKIPITYDDNPDGIFKESEGCNVAPCKLTNEGKACYETGSRYDDILTACAKDNVYLLDNSIFISITT